MTDKFNEMKKENDDQKELLNEAEQQSELCKRHLRKLEKAQAAVEQKSTELEVQVNIQFDSIFLFRKNYIY